MSRTAQVERNTLETQISVSVDLDGSGKSAFNTGVPFLEHMLDQVARHGLIDIDIKASGDTHIDDHHTVEDTGIGVPDLGAGARQGMNSSENSRSNVFLIPNFGISKAWSNDFTLGISAVANGGSVPGSAPGGSSAPGRLMRRTRLSITR